MLFSRLCEVRGSDLVSINADYEKAFLVDTIRSVLDKAGLPNSHELWWVGAYKDRGYYSDYRKEMHWLDGTGMKLSIVITANGNKHFNFDGCFH